jgi:hypothetical protein
VPGRKEFIFEIKAYTPETIPMFRLAEYMHDLALLLGERANVHFVRLVPSSTGLVHSIDNEAIPRVNLRVDSMRNGLAPQDVLEAFKAIDRRLAQDNADGAWREVDGAKIIDFPGVRGKKTPPFGPVTQQTVLDGRVIRLGGRRKDVVPITLETHDGFETHCEANREIARSLSRFYDGPTVRVIGAGKWVRGEDSWALERLLISSFQELDGRTLPEVVADLRSAPNAKWKSLKDPLKELKEIRGDDGDD